MIASASLHGMFTFLPVKTICPLGQPITYCFDRKKVDTKLHAGSRKRQGIGIFQISIFVVSPKIVLTSNSCYLQSLFLIYRLILVPYFQLGLWQHAHGVLCRISTYFLSLWRISEWLQFHYNVWYTVCNVQQCKLVCTVQCDCVTSSDIISQYKYIIM